MSSLTKLPNIGKVLADKLTKVGITSEQELKTIGSENAIIKLATVYDDVCINMLYGIEGAIQGVRWHGLDKSRKHELSAFYKTMIDSHTLSSLCNR